MPRKLTNQELRDRSREIMEVARYAAQRQAKGLGKASIKVELRKRGHKHKVIRAAFEGIDTLWPVDGCADILFKKFNGLTKPGRIIIETGLNAGYNRKTVYRALVRLGAELKKRGKRSMWKFGPWVTERRPFLDEVHGHVGDDEEIDVRGKTSKAKRARNCFATQRLGAQLRSSHARL